MRLIYVAGPYMAPTPAAVEDNVTQAIDAGNRLISAGLFAVVPHLSHFLDHRSPQPYETWIEMDLAILDRCDALLRLPGESKGADGEVQFALRKGIPVFYDERTLLRVARSR